MTAIDFTELHDDLRAVAADVLARDRVDWATLVEAGWVGLEVTDALGGAGATFAETALICTELGRAAAPPPTWVVRYWRSGCSTGCQTARCATDCWPTSPPAAPG